MAEVSRAEVSRAVVSIARAGQEARRGESYTRHELQSQEAASGAGRVMRGTRCDTYEGPAHCDDLVRARVRVRVSACSRTDERGEEEEVPAARQLGEHGGHVHPSK